MTELDQKEEEQKQPNNMFYLSEEFKQWLAADLTRQKDLPHWEEFFNFFSRPFPQI